MSEFKRLEVHWYGLVLLRTKRFEGMMDRFGQRRITRPAGWFLLYLMPIAAAIGFFIFVRPLEALFSPSAPAYISYMRTVSILGNLGIPGINPYLPLVDGWIALIVAMIIHEGAHGVIARSLGLPVKASGLIFFLFVPIGAFVDVDEDALKLAKASQSGRVLAAGAGINFVVGVICLLLLVGTVGTMRPRVDGLGVTGVYPNSTAGSIGLKPGDFITAVNGSPLDSRAVVVNSSWYRPGQVINMTVWHAGGLTTYNNLTVGSLSSNDTRTGNVTKTAFLGITDVDYAQLTGLVTDYTNSFLSRPVLYVCIPTLPICQSQVPISDTMSVFYTSSYGPILLPAATLLYWLFFLNFSLAIFNSLPLYPLDGGQAFRVGVKALGGEKLSEKSLERITSAASFIVLAMVVIAVAGPYLL